MTNHTCLAEAGDAGNAMNYRVGGLFGILLAGLLGFLLPSMVAERGRMRVVYFLFQTFASGVVVATGLVHVLPDAIKSSENPCVGLDPKFPWVGMIVLFSVYVTFTVEHILQKYLHYRYLRNVAVEESPGTIVDSEKASEVDAEAVLRLQKYRVIAYCLEGGIIFHSVFVGLTLGTSRHVNFVRALTFALLFHQGFEGIALGGAVAKAKLGTLKTWLFALAFALTCPAGVALGIIVGNSFNQNSKTALATEVAFNSISAGILLYNGLVDLIIPTFEDDPDLKPKSSMETVLGIASMFAGGGCMSVVAKWA